MSLLIKQSEISKLVQENEADIIVTSAIIGLAIDCINKGHPIQFDHEHPTEEEEIILETSALKKLRDTLKPSIIDYQKKTRPLKEIRKKEEEIWKEKKPGMKISDETRLKYLKIIKQSNEENEIPLEDRAEIFEMIAHHETKELIEKIDDTISIEMRSTKNKLHKAIEDAINHTKEETKNQDEEKGLILTDIEKIKRKTGILESEVKKLTIKIKEEEEKIKAETEKGEEKIKAKKEEIEKLSKPTENELTETENTGKNNKIPNEEIEKKHSEIEETKKEVLKLSKNLSDLQKERFSKKLYLKEENKTLEDKLNHYKEKEREKISDIKNIERMTQIISNDNLLEDLINEKYSIEGNLQSTIDHMVVISILSKAIDETHKGFGEKILDNQSPQGKEGELITGKTKSEKQEFKYRNINIKKPGINDAIKDSKHIYQGRGAYTGLIAKLEKGEYEIQKEGDNTILYPTERVAYELYNKISEDKYDNLETIDPDWPITQLSSKEFTPLGIIGGLSTLSEDKTEGMGNIPVEKLGKDHGKSRVGYVHGMCTAITHCPQNGSLTPLEMATGAETTKMASCFACTTYMYANGYPPSSIHLGRGESWVPPNANYVRLESDSDLEKVLETNCNRETYENRLDSWKNSIYNYIKEGAKCISVNKNLVNHEFGDSTLAMIGKLANGKLSDTQETNEDLEKSKFSELFLSALTHHKKDSERIKNVFREIKKETEDMVKLRRTITPKKIEAAREALINKRK